MNKKRVIITVDLDVERSENGEDALDFFCENVQEWITDYEDSATLTLTDLNIRTERRKR